MYKLDSIARCAKRGLLVAALAAAACLPAHAQVQRSFLNLGFEEPNLQTIGCRVYIGESFVPGWTTDHSPYQQENAGGCVVPPGFVVGQPAPIIEIWKTPRQGVDARSGSQLAELNAEVQSRISQNVCLVNGEQIGWTFSHRGRNSSTIQDVMEFLVGTAPIVRVGTTNSGTGGVVTTYQGTAASVAGPGGWRDYSGTFTYSGSSGVNNIGFEAISAAGGATLGNFLDDIQVTLTPFLELLGSDFSSIEGSANGAPSLRVVGTASSDLQVVVSITGGTAVLGSDFTTPNGSASFTVTIPAGVYDGTSEIPLGLASIGNEVIQDNRTVTFEILPSPGDYSIASTTTCGGEANAAAAWTIVDNDIDLLTTKSTNNEAPLTGEAFEYTVTFANNTARPTIAPLDAHDVNAQIEDAVPAGLAFGSWVCQASSGASCPGGAVDGSTNGSGAIGGTAFLPAGSSGIGGLLTYTISATVEAGAAGCEAITNTSTIITPPGFAEGTSADPGFVTPPPGGQANNTASVDVRPACADLSIVKSNDLDALTSGDETVYRIVVTNDGPSAADGAVVQDPPADGLSCTAVTCGDATGGAVCPAAPTVAQLQGSGVMIPTLPNGGSLTFSLTCTVTATGTP